MSGRAKRKTTIKIDVEAPTPEQAWAFDIEDIHDKVKGVTIKLGKAYRRRPMIDTLQNMFSDAEYKALKHYRHHADVADRSPLKDSLNKAPGGGTGVPSIEILNACRVRDDCERAAGSLRDILRAVVVYDISLSQWAMEKAGGQQVTSKGVTRIMAKNGALKRAKAEIVIAAQRVRNELDADALCYGKKWR